MEQQARADNIAVMPVVADSRCQTKRLYISNGHFDEDDRCCCVTVADDLDTHNLAESVQPDLHAVFRSRWPEPSDCKFLCSHDQWEPVVGSTTRMAHTAPAIKRATAQEIMLVKSVNPDAVAVIVFV